MVEVYSQSLRKRKVQRTFPASLRTVISFFPHLSTFLPPVLSFSYYRITKVVEGGEGGGGGGGGFKYPFTTVDIRPRFSGS